MICEPSTKTAHHLFRDEAVLRAPLITPAFDECHDAIRAQFAVDTQVAAVAQSGEHGVEGCPDTDLEVAPSGIQLSDVVRHLHLDCVRRARKELSKWSRTPARGQWTRLA